MKPPRDGRNVAPTAHGGEWESINWVVGVNAANGWPWDFAVMLVVYGLLRFLEVLSSPLRAIARGPRGASRGRGRK